MSAFESWLFGRFGPAERAVTAWLRDAVWPETALCCACGRITDGQTLCPSCRQDLQAQGYVFSWDHVDLAPGATAWGLRPHAGIHRPLVHKLKYNAEARAGSITAACWRKHSPGSSPCPAVSSLPAGITVQKARSRFPCPGGERT